MRFDRSAGVLCHLSSLPGPSGIGDLGDEAFRFVDFLCGAGQSYWQVLPLGPSDDGNPYVAQSSWAGAPFLVSLDRLRDAGDLTPQEVDSARVQQTGAVDYGRVSLSRRELLARAASRCFERNGPDRQRLDEFCQKEAAWLDDWALFAAVKKSQGGQPWWSWPKPIALRTAAGLKEHKKKLDFEIRVEKYVQLRFFEQWDKLREKIAAANIKVIGDIPIYCARDSADVWASRDMFLLNPDGVPKVVSGVPPDYFAKDGQRWGTPVYDWKRNKLDGFAWWISRLRGALRQADVVRIDHFRAFESYWEVPAEAPTAKTGRWVKGPGEEFFKLVKKALGDAPFIAEDLGIITRAVRDLRDHLDLPGMKVLQFAFGEGAGSPHLPIRHCRNAVCYTGTHDNDTTGGWYEKASDKEKDTFRRYTATDGSFCHYHMIRLAYSSVADLAIVPMQDVLGLPSWARMNVPGIAKGNWTFKLTPEQVNEGAQRMLRELADLFGRLPGQKEAVEQETEYTPPA
jgi:4-alpha-glucanotransferase